MPRPANKEGLILLIHEIMVGEQAESFETEKRYRKEEDDDVCEQRCRVYYDETGGTKYWIWNDIVLKTESIGWETKKPSGKRAISVDLNPKFKEDAFGLPKGIEVIGIPSP